MVLFRDFSVQFVDPREKYTTGTQKRSDAMNRVGLNGSPGLFTLDKVYPVYGYEGSQSLYKFLLVNDKGYFSWVDFEDVKIAETLQPAYTDVFEQSGTLPKRGPGRPPKDKE